mmetsp:Transcript_30629/g.37842  ORF Transcript_30629/g.37842 Transcript_30629/m.37842 type:complete len:133 (-) Transcript_30629:394-792(-)
MPKMSMSNFEMANEQLARLMRALDTNKINLDLLKTKIDTVLRPISPRLRAAMRKREKYKVRSETRKSHLKAPIALQGIDRRKNMALTYDKQMSSSRHREETRPISQDNRRSAGDGGGSHDEVEQESEPEIIF